MKTLTVTKDYEGLREENGKKVILDGNPRINVGLIAHFPSSNVFTLAVV